MRFNTRSKHVLSRALLAITLFTGTSIVSAEINNQLLLASSIDDEKRSQPVITDEKQQQHDSGWAFYLDNDLFASPGKDRDYTGGASITLSGARAAKYAFSIDPALSLINDTIGLEQSINNTLNSFEFGMTAFTPDKIEAKTPLFDDRPYASLVYMANTRQTINYEKRSSIITSLTLGVLGLDIAGNLQNAIHNVVDGEQAKGWNNQISDGGEFTFRYSIARQSVRWADYLNANSNYEIKTASNINIGYLTDVSWSLSGRFGKIRTPWSSFNPQNTAYSEKSTPLPETKVKNELYFWAGMSVHLRAYNTLLQGQFKDSPVTYDRDELHHVVGEAWLGMTGELLSGLRLSYFLRGQSSEIKSGPGSRNPVWGGVIISRSI